jgi:phenylpropionate dioxygenase-like ring-hydroxylating dioxygenase large terminal subunit
MSPTSRSPVAITGPVIRSTAAVETPENRRQLVEMARRQIAHVEAGHTPAQTEGIVKIPASRYLDADRWAREVEMFRRTPLMLALGGELRGPNSYKAMTVMDVPVLLVRGADMVVRAFVNQCTHRGAIVVADGCGTARRFACPYHNWVYDTSGDLVGVADRQYFGEIDTSCMGLTPLPVAERAGLVFVVITPGAPMDIDEHLCGYDKVLDFFGYGDWHLIKRTELVGPNWKVAYDGYLDYYHLPFLHKNSFGPDMYNKAIYNAWGPHQRVTTPDATLLDYKDLPDDEWDLDQICGGVWTIFPHISIAGGNNGGQIAQLFPGKTPDTSITILNYYTAYEPDEEQRAAADQRADFVAAVVRDEDYATGIELQRALAAGGKTEVLFGRNEGGGQHFHRTVDERLARLTPSA